MAKKRNNANTAQPPELGQSAGTAPTQEAPNEAQPELPEPIVNVDNESQIDPTEEQTETKEVAPVPPTMENEPVVNVTTGDNTTTEDEVFSVDYNPTPPQSRTPSTSPRRKKTPVSTPTRLPSPVRQPAHLEHVPLPQKLFEPTKPAIERLRSTYTEYALIMKSLNREPLPVKMFVPETLWTYLESNVKRQFTGTEDFLSWAKEYVQEVTELSVNWPNRLKGLRLGGYTKDHVMLLFWHQEEILKLLGIDPKFWDEPAAWQSRVKATLPTLLPELEERMWNIWNSKLLPMNSWQEFVDRVHKEAKHFAQGTTAASPERVRAAEKHAHKRKRSSEAFPKSAKQTKGNFRNKKPEAPKPKSSSSSSSTSSKTIACFVCGQTDHKLRECPQASNMSEGERKRLYKNKVNDHSSSYLVLNDTIVHFVWDTGAEMTVITAPMVEELELSVIPLSQPIILEYANGLTETVSNAAQVKSLCLIDISGSLITCQRDIQLPIIASHTDRKTIFLGTDYIPMNKEYAERVHSGYYTGNINIDRISMHGDDEISMDGIQDVQSSCTTWEHWLATIRPRLLAACKGLPNEWLTKLQVLLDEYWDVFRAEIAADPPARVTPCETSLKPGAQPYRCRQRRIKYKEAQWLTTFTKELVANGFVVRNPTSKWASPVLVVSKGEGAYRLVIDFREVNKRSVTTTWPMPYQEEIVTKLNNKRFFIKLDLFKGFWLMPLAEHSREMFSFMTHDGIFTPQRLPQGAANSATQFQARMAEVFGHLPNLEIWIDDILGHCSHYEDWFQTLEAIFKGCEASGLKLNVNKCTLFLLEAHFCGRTYNSQGVSHDPARIEKLMEVPIPATAAQLQQFLLSSRWMAKSIPEYDKLTILLQSMLTTAMSGLPQRTKRAAATRHLSKFGWNQEHTNAFESLKKAIGDQTILHYPDPNKLICIFTDASDYHCAGIVTQIPIVQEFLPFDQQDHEPLGFCGHHFTGSELNWSIVHKEAFAIVHVFRRLSYLLVTRAVLYTDHKNLTALFTPGEHDLKAHQQRLLRWSLEIQIYDFVVRYIKGEDNVWADLLSRWGQRVPLTVLVSAISTVDDTRVQPLRDIIWPTLEEIYELQQVHGCDRHDPHGRLLIPSQAIALRLRLAVIAHAVPGEHYPKDLTLRTLKAKYYWNELQEDVESICASCLHCIPTMGGIKIPRPLGSAIHGQKPNAVLHFDFLYIQKASPANPNEWIFVIRDDFSGMVELIPCEVPNSEVATVELLRWRSRFGTSQIYVSDKGTYFMSALMKELSVRLNIQHHATMAYIHYNNGTVEVINRLVLRALRTMISELRWKKSEWHHLVPTVQHFLNHKPQRRLN